VVSPQVIVLGGGILKRDSLWPMIRKHFVALNNGYISQKKVIGNSCSSSLSSLRLCYSSLYVDMNIIDQVDTYIVPSRFNAEGSGTTAGAVGSLALAFETAANPASTSIQSKL
jgi:hypothetical protein